MSQTAIILLAHGSSDPHWQATFEQLAAPSCSKVPEACTAYMELCEPSLQRRVAELAARGVRYIRIVPLFLARGRHLRKDVPAMVVELEREYRDIHFELTPPVGEHPLLGEAIARIVSDTLAQGKGESS